MTKLEQLRDIAKRLEEVSGPDTEIDKDIASAFGLDWDYSADWGPRYGESPVAFPYTKSIDAALGLVDRTLPGVRLQLEHDGGRWHFTVWNDPNDDTWTISASAPAGYLAILRAWVAAMIDRLEDGE